MTITFIAFVLIWPWLSLPGLYLWAKDFNRISLRTALAAALIGPVFTLAGLIIHSEDIVVWRKKH